MIWSNSYIGERHEERQHLCGDKGYTGQPADQAVRTRGYVPHIPQRGEDPTARRRHPTGEPGVGRSSGPTPG